MDLRDMMKNAKRRRAKTKVNPGRKKKTREGEELSSLKSNSEVKPWQQHSESTIVTRHLTFGPCVPDDS